MSFRPPTRLGRTLRRGALGLAVAAVVLALLEGTARVTGCAPEGSEPSPLLAQRLDFDPVQAGPTPGTLTFMPMGPDNPSLRWTTSSPAQPADLRIVTFGGSATFGLPFSPFQSFSGLLQRELVALAPDRRVEVINTGICSMGSSRVLQVAQAVLQRGSPDLLVVYSGNNEFLDRAAIALAAQAASPLGAWAHGPLGQLHLFRWLERHLLRPGAPLPQDHQLTIGEALRRPTTVAERELVRERYQRNLTAIVRLARARAIPVVLATVPSNQRDFCQACQDVVTDAEEEPLLAALEQAAAAGDARGVAKLARRAGDRLEDEAGQVRLARSLLAVGDAEGARRHFAEAERLSSAAFRGTDDLRDVVRSVARGRGATLCDTTRAFEAAAMDGIPGNDLFRDECHPNERGHVLLAQTLLGCILEEDLLSLGTRDPAAVAAAEAVITAPDDPGCPWRLDRSHETSNTPSGPYTWPSEPCALARAGHRAFMAGDRDIARRFYRAALERGGPAGWLNLDEGLVARLDGDLPAARAALTAAADAHPDDPEVRNWLAISGGLPAAE